MNKERLDYIDILKGIGILFVIFSHSGAEKWFMSKMGDFFVPLFFVASGYTFKQRNEPFLPLFKKKAKRLLKPYFFFSLLMLLLYKRFYILDVVGVFYSRYCIYPYHSVNNIFLMGGGNPPLWFLTSMLTAFLAFYLLVKFEAWTKWLLIAFVLFTFSCQYLPILLPWSLDTACLTGSFMYAGFLLRKGGVIIDRQMPFYLFVSIAFVAICLVNGSDNLSVREYGRCFLLYFMGSVLGTIVLLWVSKLLDNTFLRGFLISLGRHSLVIFCIQMFLLRICHQVHGMLCLPTEGLAFYPISFIKILLVAISGLYISIVMNKYMSWLFK